MKLSDYSGVKKITLDDFLALDEEQAVKFDFLTQGEEADRAALTNSIYHELFPWFDEQIHAGDTLNTYRIAVKKYYGKYYRFLDRKKQLEIIAIIKKYTPHNDDQIFEFEDTDKSGKPYYQLCNNYQLGNFDILPIHGGINPKRAQEPYNDFFDKFFSVVYDFYAGTLKLDNDLTKAIDCQKAYFKQFDDIGDFVEQNFLWDFFTDTDDDSATCERLSDSSSFEEYVSLVTKIVAKRGKTLYKVLHDNVETKSEMINILSKNSAALAQRYSLDEQVSFKLAKLIQYHNVAVQSEKISEKYQGKLDSTNSLYNEQISEKETEHLVKKFTWIKWWYWIVAFILIFVLKMIPAVHSLMSIVNVLFWLALIADVIYYFVFKSNNETFEKNKNNKIEKLRIDLDQAGNEIINEHKQAQNDLFDSHEFSFSCMDVIPEEYRNLEDTSYLIKAVEEKRADSFKEAYELLENSKHRQRLEEQARRSAEAEERKAEYQRQESEAMNRQARATEEQSQILQEQSWKMDENNNKLDELNRQLSEKK